MEVEKINLYRSNPMFESSFGLLRILVHTNLSVIFKTGGRICLDNNKSIFLYVLFFQ